MIDSSSVRVHQHGANHCPAGESIISPGGGPKNEGDPVALPTIAGNHLPSGTWVARAAGLTTKIHALVDALGRPIRLKPSPGQAQGGRSAADRFGTVRAGQILLADRASVQLASIRIWLRTYESVDYIAISLNPNA